MRAGAVIRSNTVGGNSVSNVQISLISNDLFRSTL